jgi:hypothetical protein
MQRMCDGMVRQQCGINLVRCAKRGVNPSPIREERSSIGVVSNILAVGELRGGRVSQTGVSLQRREGMDQLTASLKKCGKL